MTDTEFAAQPPTGASVSDTEGSRAGLRATLVALGIGASVALIGYHQGGYGLPTIGQVAIGALWLILIGAVMAVVPLVKPRGYCALALLLLAGLTVWTLTSLLWSQAPERTVATAVQLLAIVAIFGLATVAVARRDRTAVIAGVAGGIAVLSFFAVMQRLNPGLVSAPVSIADQVGHQARAFWPIGYWNALAVLSAMGLVLLLRLASGSTQRWTRALSGACVPVVALSLVFTISRAGLVLAAIGIALSLALGPLGRRVIATQLGLAGCAAVVIATAIGYRELMDGLVASGAGASQADETFVVLICLSAVAGLVALVAGQLGPDPDPAAVNLKLRFQLIGGFVALAAVVVAALAVSGALDAKFKAFTSTDTGLAAGRGNSIDRLSTVGSNGRWQLWQGAVDAGNEHPLIGQGGGEFEPWWLANGSRIKVRNAHGLFVETYAELGLIGLVLLVGFVIAAALGCVRALRRAGPQLGEVSAGVAAFFIFLISCAIDWTWQESVVPTCAVLLLAALLAADHSSSGNPEPRWRLLAGVIAAAGIALAIPPTVASNAVLQSKKQVQAGNLAEGLSQARSATSWQPYSASAWQQEALVLDAGGSPAQARIAALKAIDNEPGSWQNWLVLAQIDARAGRVREALADFRKARDRNPNSQLFKPTN